VSEDLTVLVAARDEEDRIGETVSALRGAFPEAEIVVADDGSRDMTPARAKEAGARVVALPRRGKGQALTLAERECRDGPLLLCDADLRGDVRPLLDAGADLAVAAFAQRVGDGLGIAKSVSRALIERRTGVRLREPLSGQRALSRRARATVFPVAAGFGVETRMTIDALHDGLDVREIELDLDHRATGRDLRGFVHRGRQLGDLVLATIAPQGTNFRGLRLPLVGAVVGLAVPSVSPVAAIGLADDLWSGPERGFRAHLQAGVTTGTLKLAAIPLWALWRSRSLSGAALVALAANVLNQLDTRPGRALKAFLIGSAALGGRPRRAFVTAVLLAPYDHREMTMLGDAGSNALGAVLGLESVRRLTGLRRTSAIAALAAATVVGERRSLGRLIETTPGLRSLDALGRHL
jgi:hypothetical protein